LEAVVTGSVLDVILVVLLVLYAVAGFRQGILLSTLSLVGFLGGGAIGMAVLPALLANVDWVTSNEFLRVAVLVVLVFLCASIGQAVTVPIGSRLRSRVRGRQGRALDAVLGSVATVLAVSLLVWFVAGAVRGAAPTNVGRAIGESRVLSTIDKVVPPAAGQLFAGFRSLLDQNGIPKVFGGLTPEPIQPVAPPDTLSAQSAGVQTAARSVVRVTGVAEACRRGQEGSGFVVAPGKVVTNAHVVAGMRSASVQVQGVGREYAAQIVVFDPDRDLAVLAVSGLSAAPLQLGDSLNTGAAAVVAGFPLDGPFRLDAARVRATLAATGSDIYGEPGVQREIYSLYARVEPGNSGGPLLAPDGKVVGVVFAKSLDDPTTGYALTLAEAKPVLDAASGASRAVSTGACSTG
jgi:S1-C subfamily serine protease